MSLQDKKSKQHSVRCEAKVSTGKQCKKMSLVGYKFCRVHCFGRIANVPWYFNPILHSLLAIAVAAFLGWYFFIRGPSPEKQDETLAIVRRMESAQQENAAHLQTIFPWGYLLFTATERKQIVPLSSPMDKVLHFDWQSGKYSIDLTPTLIILSLPDFTLQQTNGTILKGEFHRNGFGLPRSIGYQMRPFKIGEWGLLLEVVATNIDGVVIALGPVK